MVVQMVEANGLTRDLTSQAAYTVADPSLVRIEGATLYPVADGEGYVRECFADVHAETRGTSDSSLLCSLFHTREIDFVAGG